MKEEGWTIEGPFFIDLPHLFENYKEEIDMLMVLDRAHTHDTWALRMLDAYFHPEDKGRKERIGRLQCEMQANGR